MVSVSKRHWIIWLVLLSLVLAACERPFQPSSNVPTGPDSSQVTVTPDTGVGVSTPDAGEAGSGETTPDEETGTGEGETTGGETTPGEETGTGEGETTEGGETTEEPAGETGSETGESSEGQETGSEETTSEPAEEETTEETGTTTTQPANPSVHIVAAGDTLYKIGLRYGISWVRLAQFNNLSNPNQLRVGQEIRIPGTADTPEPTPSPQTEEIYVVKVGDNLYRIGLAYGISWIQIAEANGIVNPNYLIVGQQIKIPTAVPGPTPQFSHTVRTGDTIFRISLQYGVTWTAIAEANNIQSPYVIFPGQVLVIPGA